MLLRISFVLPLLGAQAVTAETIAAIPHPAGTVTVPAVKKYGVAGISPNPYEFASAAEACNYARSVWNYGYCGDDLVVPEPLRTGELAITCKYVSPGTGSCNFLTTRYIGYLCPEGPYGYVTSTDHTMCTNNQMFYTCPPDGDWVLNGATCTRTVTYTLNLTPGYATIEPGPGKSYTFTARVTGQNGNPPSISVPVTVKVEVDPASGGHDHGEIYAKRDKGTVLPTSGANSFNITFTSTEVSGTHKITATCDLCANSPKTATVDVKVAGLFPIPPSGLYALYETDGSVIGAVQGKHPSNHYLTTIAANRLLVLAINYHHLHPTDPVLHVNDASLMWGGKFDISGKWTGYHYEHDRGTVVDVRANTAAGNIPEANFTDFENMALRQGVDAQLHCSATRDPSIDNCVGDVNRHYHIVLD